MLYGIGLAFEDVGGGVGFDALGYMLAIGYCGVKDDDGVWLVALATNQTRDIFI
ncbi:MAG: hypothetical protein ACM65M_25780 [Microcoleus sp.]